MKVLLASFEPRRDRDPDRLTLRSKANPHRERQAVIEPTDQDPTTLRAHPQRPRQHPSGRYGALDREDVATTERAPHRAQPPALGSLRPVAGCGPPHGFRSASRAGGADERHLEPAENRLAVLLQLAEAFGPVEREVGGTHALEDLAIAV